MLDTAHAISGARTCRIFFHNELKEEISTVLGNVFIGRGTAIYSHDGRPSGGEGDDCCAPRVLQPIFYEGCAVKLISGSSLARCSLHHRSSPPNDFGIIAEREAN